ncbi:unnamed protein product, partial [Oikopleura dioica]
MQALKKKALHIQSNENVQRSELENLNGQMFKQQIREDKKKTRDGCYTFNGNGSHRKNQADGKVEGLCLSDDVQEEILHYLRNGLDNNR